MSADRFLSRLVVPLGRLDDQAHAHRLGAGLDAADFAFDDRANFLDVPLEFAFGDAGGLFTDAAQIFRLTAAGNASAAGGFLTQKHAFSCHNQLRILRFRLPGPLVVSFLLSEAV